MSVPMNGTAIAPTETVEDLLARNRSRRLPDPGIRRMLRIEAGLTQDDVAAAVGVTRTAISRWESGDRHPRGPFASLYAEVLRELAAEVAP